MYKGIILCFYILAEVQFSHPYHFKPCSTYDTECITRNSDNILSIAVNGDPAMNIKTLDPVKYKYIEGNLGIIKYKLFNSTILGSKDCHVVYSNITLHKNLMNFKMVCPYLYMYGVYEISGVLIILPIEGKGDYTLETKNYHFDVETEIKFLEGNDGKRYIHLKNFNVNGEIQGGMVVDLKNLFDGQHKEFADAALKFANEQWKPVSKLLQGPTVYTNIKRIIKNMNNYLKNVSVDNLLINIK